MADIELEVRRLKVKPGDVLVFNLGESVTPPQWEDVANRIMPAVPQGVSALLLPYGATIDQIRAEDIVPIGTTRAFRVKGPKQ